MISGLVTTIASMPVDIAKTRLQNMKYIDGEKTKSSSSTRFSFNFCPGKPEYRGAGDVLSKVVKNEVSSKTNKSSFRIDVNKALCPKEPAKCKKCP